MEILRIRIFCHFQFKHASCRFKDKEFIDSVLSDINEDKLRGFLQELSREPHIAAARRDRELVKWMKESWEEAGVETVSLATYDILLSYPNPEKPNKVGSY